MDSELKYIGVPLRSFIGGKHAVVDLYIKLSEDHYIRIVNKLNEYDSDQLSRYQNKEVDCLYVRSEDFREFAEQSLRVMGAVSESPITTKQKLSIISGTVEHFFIELASLGVSRPALKMSNGINKALCKLIAANPKLTDIVFVLSQSPTELVKHSIATSMFAGLLIKTMGWKEHTIVHAALGGLLHDIGLVNLPEALLWKPYSEMTKQEAALYNEHPWRGATMLSNVPGVPPEILAIVMEHHDLPSSPTELTVHRALESYPLSKAVAFSDGLADLVIKTGGNPHPKLFMAAVDLLESSRNRDFPSLYFEAARKLIKSQAA